MDFANINRDAAPLRLGVPGPRMANRSVSYRCERYDVVKLMNPKPLLMPPDTIHQVPVVPKPHIRLTEAVLALINNGPVRRRWGSESDTSDTTMRRGGQPMTPLIPMEPR